VSADGEDGRRLRGDAKDGFTQRTRSVLDHLHKEFEASATKRRRPSEGAAVPLKAVNLDTLVVGSTKLEACRWFFETLVLFNKGYVELQQAEPYGGIVITPLEKMASQ
jgi:chromatin segregation and condensation protein Rec8/ScpA/Scc1 (kleisin family)